MTTNPQPVSSNERSFSQPGPADLLRRGLALALVYLMLPMGIGDVYAQSYGQYAPPPPNQQYNQPYNQQYGQQYNPQYGQQYGQQYVQSSYYGPLSPDQLDQLVAPIALYPDALVAQVLAASTYPTQVVDADRWMQSYQGYGPDQVAQMANSMPWDPSVKSLTAFPSVLDNMAQNLDWTTQLGNAYYNQPQDVMEAVQAMRQQAYDSGYLRSSSQMYVDYSPQYISIMPANPDVVYVPYYDPWNVYGPVIHPWYQYYRPAPPQGVYIGGTALGFGFGIAIGAFSHWGWGWGHWHPNWDRREVYYGRDRYISRSRSVFNRGHFGDFDRHYARRDFQRNNNGHARGFNRQNQFQGRQNPNFQRAPQYRQFQNGQQQNFHQQPQQNFNQRNQQNFNHQQPFHNQQNFNQRPQQKFNRQNSQQFRNQPNFNHAPQTYNRPQQQFRAQPQQNFNQRQPFQNRPQKRYQPQQNFNQRPQQHFNQRPQQNFNHGQRPQNQGRQFHGRQYNRPQNNNHQPNHSQGHPNNQNNGHGHGRR